MAATTDSDNGIRVTVSPAQSSFFAGEPFSVTVTFTNTHSANASTSAKRTASQSHKRAAHSISTAALSRPPTSPRTPQTAFAVLSSSSSREGKKKDVGSGSSRRGLIGLNLNRDNAPSGSSNGDSTRRKTLITKSMSMSITTDDPDLSGVLQSIKSPQARARDASLPLNPNHPHARKVSVLDGQSQVQLQLHDISTSPSSVSSPFPGSTSASTSAFSLALDTISEGVAAHGSSSTDDASTHSYPPRPSAHRSAYSGLGQGPPPLPDFNHPPKTAFASTFAQPNTELVLYSYAQLVGTLTLGDSSSTDTRSQQAAALNSVRVALLRKQRQAVGGGSMDIRSSLDMSPSSSRTSIAGFTNPRMRRSHSRASSLSSSIFSLLSPSPSSTSPALPWTPARKASSSSIISSILSPSVSSPATLSSPSNGQHVGLGLHLDGAEEELVDPATPLPTFDVQPAMLAVDLTLGPGESRSYTYTLPLPANLPPTYKGRMLKFTYHLVVGVCRAAPTPSLGSGYAGHGPPGGGKGTSTSRVMRVPIRIYNSVVESGAQHPYDLLWPASQSKQKEQPAKVVESTLQPSKSGKLSQHTVTSPSPHIRSSDDQLEALASLQRHAIRLLASLTPQAADPSALSPSTPMSPTSPPPPTADQQSQGELTGCREAVEILTRNMRKASYDVNKGGVKVAVLTFTKSAYRLGETVVGVVELNERGSRARVLKITALLEAQELLPAPLSPSSPVTKKLRKIHAEHHSSLIPSTLRTTFTLDIPSDAAPAFQCSCNADPNGGSTGGLEWKVRLCLLVAIANEHAREGFDGLRVKHLIRDGPRGEWGSAWRPTRGIAPLQNIDRRKAAAAARNSPQAQAPPRGWAAYLLSSVLSPGEREYHDGDEEPEDEDEYDDYGGFGHGLAVDESGEVDIGGGEKGWEELRVETVECEVPIRVWPGNTAFKPLEVAFEL